MFSSRPHLERIAGVGPTVEEHTATYPFGLILDGVPGTLYRACWAHAPADIPVEDGFYAQFNITVREKTKLAAAFSYRSSLLTQRLDPFPRRNR